MSAVEPAHFQAAIWLPWSLLAALTSIAAVSAVSLYGVRVRKSVPEVNATPSAAGSGCTVMTPLALVVTDWTNLVGLAPAVLPVFASQPQPFAVPTAVEFIVSTASVMVVRHCEAASTTSDMRALMVYC